MSKVTPKLPDGVYSPQDLTALIVEVRGYARWASHASIKKRVDAKSPMEPPQVSAPAAQLLNSWASQQPLSTARFDELIDMLEDYKNSAPTMTITLAAPPTNAVKQTLTNWCRDNIAPNALVSFRFNSTLLGGMVVRYGSRIFDWSFRRQILNGRASFSQILRRM